MSDTPTSEDQTAWTERFLEWVEYHTSVVPRQDWPPPMSEVDGELIKNPAWKALFGRWAEEFWDLNCTIEELREASKAESRNPGGTLGEQLGRVINAVKMVRQRDAQTLADRTAKDTAGREGAEAFHTALSREVCEQRSWDCPECGGDGIATRWAHLDETDSETECAFFCRCPMGRWMEHLYKNNWPEIHAQWADLQSRTELWDPKLSHWTWSNKPTEYVAPPNPLKGYYIMPGGGIAPTPNPAATATPQGSRYGDGEDEEAPPIDVPPRTQQRFDYAPDVND